MLPPWGGQVQQEVHLAELGSARAGTRSLNTSRLDLRVQSWTVQSPPLTFRSWAPMPSLRRCYGTYQPYCPVYSWSWTKWAYNGWTSILIFLFKYKKQIFFPLMQSSIGHKTWEKHNQSVTFPRTISTWNSSCVAAIVLTAVTVVNRPRFCRFIKFCARFHLEEFFFFFFS